MIYLKKLKDKGFKLQSNWQDLKSNSIFVLGTNKQTNFFFYQKKALAKGCKYIICDKKFKNIFLKDKIYYFPYQKNDLNKIYRYFFPS